MFFLWGGEGGYRSVSDSVGGSEEMSSSSESSESGSGFLVWLMCVRYVCFGVLERGGGRKDGEREGRYRCRRSRLSCSRRRWDRAALGRARRL